MPFDGLYEKEKQMTTIQNGYGQQVDDCQIDTNQGNEKNEITDPRFGLISSHFSNHDGSADGIGGDIAGNQFADDDHHQFDDIVGLFETLGHRLKWIELLDIKFAAAGNTDDIAFDIFAEYVFRRN